MKEKIRSIIFMGLILYLSITNIIAPKKVFSNKENRYLQEFPEINKKTIISGEFSKGFEIYTTDQFISRDNWISLKTMADLAMLKKDNTRVYFGKDNYLFDIDKKLDEEQFKRNIKDINIFIDNISKYNKNISISSLLIPTKSAALNDKLPLYAPVVNEEDILENLKMEINKNMNIIDLKDVFTEKSNEYIYYKTDHHWTTKGAFYAYDKYMKEKIDNTIKIEDFTISEESKNFLGTSYRKASLYLGDPDIIHKFESKDKIDLQITINNQIETDSLYEESYLNKTDKYSYFLGGDKSLIEIETSVKNHKNILVIKDSFANSFIPFLTSHYENISVIDPRYFNTSIIDYIEENEIDEVLFLFNIQSFVQEKTFNVLSKSILNF